MPVVELVVAAEEADRAADALWQGSPSAVSEEALPDGRVRLVADVTDPRAVPPGWDVASVAVDPDAEDGWRSFAVPVRAGRFLLQPAWLPAVPVADDLVVIPLDPGRVFGSGSHVSTRQVLEQLDDLDLTGAAVLDVGSGSGVLAIATLLLGARRAVAIDVDPGAAAVAMANADRNGVAGGLEAVDTPVAEVAGRFDLVLANIGRRVLVELAVAVMARVAPGGAVVLAGLLDEQEEAVLTAYPSLVVEARSSVEGWTALRLRA